VFVETESAASRSRALFLSSAPLAIPRAWAAVVAFSRAFLNLSVSSVVGITLKLKDSLNRISLFS
jgi:hypothetical protein